jgi:general secretion pathway protein A
MYRDFYGLVRKPFEMTPDPSFLVLSPAHREGLAMLHYALEARKGFVALTGEVGTGKTTLVHALLSQLKSSMPSAFIFNPRVEPLDFLRMLFDEFHIEHSCRTKAEYLMALNHFLIDCLRRDQIALLIIDEAQNLSPEMLEEVRLLSNLETPTSKLLQILLVGQPELNDMLDRPELRQLRQRIVLRHHLVPFSASEVDQYLDERLRLAGYTGKGIFKRSARKELFAVTGGVPRLINVVCDSALLLGYSRQQLVIGDGIVREAAIELRLAPRETDRTGSEPAPPRGSDPKSGRKPLLKRFRLFS